MPTHVTKESNDDLSRMNALFDALGLGRIDADEHGCFVMRYDEHTSLHFQIVPGADLLKLAISVCTLGATERAQGLRVVLRSNLDAPRAERAGTMSIVPSSGQVLFNTLLPLAVPDTDNSVRAMSPGEFGAVLERMLGKALGFRQQFSRDYVFAEASIARAPMEGEHHVIRP